jgi:soluble lytic murein transglycosylase-like protein
LIVVGYFGLGLLLGAAYNAVQEYEPDEIFEVREVIEEPKEIDIELNDISLVASSMHETEEETVIESEPYYDISADGTISEESLYTVARKVGSMYSIDPLWLMAIAKTESNYDIYAVGTSNDCGLCQIIPKWSQDKIDALGLTDIFDPTQNLTLCAEILTDLQTDAYGYDRRYVSMAYNMGRAKAKQLYQQGTISDYARRIETNYDILRRNYETTY